MAGKKQTKLKRMLRLTVFVENTFEQLFSIRLSPLKFIISLGAIVILLIAAVTALIAFTGLREYIPGYPTGEERDLIVKNMHRTDSLVGEIELRDLQMRNLRSAIAGELPIDACHPDSILPKRKSEASNVVFERSVADSLFRRSIEQDVKYDVETSTQATGYNLAAPEQRLEMMFFYTPMKGIVNNRFGESQGHFGVDVVAADGTPVFSVLDGTVIFSEWTMETGLVIAIQHDNQLVSIYKHNSKLLKRAGMRVRAGELIAFVGNSGELTTGTHLHFELWYSGSPLNPEEYLTFE